MTTVQTARDFKTSIASKASLQWASAPIWSAKDWVTGAPPMIVRVVMPASFTALTVLSIDGMVASGRNACRPAAGWQTALAKQGQQRRHAGDPGGRSAEGAQDVVVRRRERTLAPGVEAVGRLGAAFVEGARSGGLMTSAKHFPGHGRTSKDSHKAVLSAGDRACRSASEPLPAR